MEAASEPGSLDLTSPDVLEALLGAEAGMLDLARRDPVTFNAYVLRDEETGARFHNEPVHEQWHDFLSSNRRAIVWASVDAGKTQQISVGRTLFELGLNPRLRIAIVSNTDAQAQKICRLIGKYVEGSTELHEVFPDLRRAKGQPWTGHHLFVERPTRSKDASVTTCGVHGNVLGARFDLIILDDILDYENTTSPAQKKDVAAWVRATLDGRLARGGRIWYLGMVWVKDDLLHELASGEAYRAMRSPVVTDEGVLTQPRRWPVDRIEEARRTMLPAEFDRQVRCRTPAHSENSPFKQEWLTWCQERGDGRNMAWQIRNLAPGERVYSGVDIGSRIDTSKQARSAIFTVLIHPNEDREVLNVWSGFWDGPTIIENIKDVHRRFGSLIFVENVHAQDFILQFARKDSAVPVRPFTTGGRGDVSENVNHPDWGFESQAVEMYNKKWIIPSKNGRSHPEIQEWLSDLLMWERGMHAGDRAMAGWIAIQGSRWGRARGKVRPGVRMPGVMNR